MILLICMGCHKGLRVSPGDSDSNQTESEAMFGEHTEYYPDKYPCVWCEDKMHFVPAASLSTLSTVPLYDVTPREAFAAIQGLGLPGEKDCSAAAVRILLEDAVIGRVSTKQIRGSHRCILDFIELGDGTRIYVGSSAYGATVYKVSKPAYGDNP